MDVFIGKFAGNKTGFSFFTAGVRRSPSRFETSYYMPLIADNPEIGASLTVNVPCDENGLFAPADLATALEELAAHLRRRT